MSNGNVPTWKKELLEKRQLWRTVGGWSVPPLASQRGSSQILLTSESNLIRSTSKPERLSNGNVRYSVGSTDDLSSVSVAELKSRFQCEVNQDVFPMVKARSAENILDDKPAVCRRSSTTFNFNVTPKFTAPVVKKTLRDGPIMEDLFKKYRKTPTRKTSTASNVDLAQNQRRRTSWKRSDSPVYFLDMNENELPAPNTVNQTVEVFEVPNESRGDKRTSPSDLADVTGRAREVVQQFEAKIRSPVHDRPVPKTRTSVNGIEPTTKPKFAVTAKRTIVKNSQ